MSGPLQGLRVLDLTSVLMGPYATQLMADMGADVVKIEPPAGDTVRDIGPMRNPGMGHIFLHVNRNKRSLVLDLKQPDGLAAFYRLAETADVVIYNIRPQAMRRLGIDYERLQALNPRIIYAGLYGYSEAGPYAGRPAYDDLIQGAAAVPSIMSMASGDEPRYVPLTLADRTVGLMASNTILAALVSRAQTGVGQQIEIPMFETMVQYVLSDHLGGETFLPAEGPSGYPRLLVKERRPYQTLDGYLCVLIYNDKQWASFLALVGHPDWFTQDPRFASIGVRTQHINDLYRMVGQAIATRTTQEWKGLLDGADIPCMPLHDIDSLTKDPHLEAVGMIRQVMHPTEGAMRQIGVPVRLSGTPVLDEQKPAPQLGQHSGEILREAGYSAQAIESLMARGITR
ncbi:MAG: acetyl-CoA acetyltransferase [Geobacteraceae bacterium GWB2_52_12]|nr:MAG: acetyl-CoA acetyltransferase [Geobacteraceae bacterium GWB2_52_12]